MGRRRCRQKQISLGHAGDQHASEITCGIKLIAGEINAIGIHSQARKIGKRSAGIGLPRNRFPRTRRVRSGGDGQQKPVADQAGPIQVNLRSKPAGAQGVVDDSGIRQFQPG